MKNSIHIIATGGTFDKIYDELKGELTFKNSHLPEIMKRVRCTVDYELTFLPLKDSLLMDDDDRSKILESCRNSSAEQIIIIHGTDSMDLTAKTLGSAFLNKTIVLTGAMVPYSVSGSDAIFNLGTAVSYVQTQKVGVYISMNGRCFTWDNVRKNRKLGIFEQLPV
ncbi:MAG: asparaginase domain-containing protein [Sphaerochaetaceae bacterium]|nr:asparaginase domain-containing protein [Sphaerochaetaceae bacterium]